MIKDNFTFLAGDEVLRTLSVLDDRQHFTIFRAGPAVAFKGRAREFLIRRIGGLFGGAFPGSTGAVALLFHRRIKTSLIEGYALITSGILHEIEWHAESVIEFECIRSRKLRLRARLLSRTDGVFEF